MLITANYEHEPRVECRIGEFVAQPTQFADGAASSEQLTALITKLPLTRCNVDCGCLVTLLLCSRCCCCLLLLLLVLSCSAGVELNSSIQRALPICMLR